ncbi:hypothetical protein IQ268_14855 [Oculatella sp. LEGE 06141]|uniref:hypothetical protein n=1 Tax=Oculatella sp. LEGE 06141 TaxID=1828648 RepID=UPI00188044A9|nr:hypothetical protein [Oculatella sp. LEGE 06141]MBE9179848.1 hypothetical protein [Oculatella sp. LEGE 06141]
MLQIPSGLRHVGKAKPILILTALVTGALALAIDTVPVQANEVLIRDGGLTVQVGGSYPPSSTLRGRRISVSPPSTVTVSDPVFYRPGSGQVVRSRIQDSTLINPVVIDSSIRDSTLINPVIVDSPGRGGRTVGRSIIIQSPGRSTSSSCRLMAEIRAACQ